MKQRVTRDSAFSMRAMRELKEGLWQWKAPHPDWKPAAGGPDPVELVLPTHGAPTDRAALERALA